MIRLSFRVPYRQAIEHLAAITAAICWRRHARVLGT
jgi:hypothetical protein